MASKKQIDDILLMLAIQLAQPGILGDVAEAYERLAPADAFEGHAHWDKQDIRIRLEHLIGLRMAWLFAGRRYMLTRNGERYLGNSGLRSQLDGRRLYLLKETRKASVAARSDARDGPLKQRS